MQFQTLTNLDDIEGADPAIETSRLTAALWQFINLFNITPHHLRWVDVTSGTGDDRSSWTEVEFEIKGETDRDFAIKLKRNPLDPCIDDVEVLEHRWTVTLRSGDKEGSVEFSRYDSRDQRTSLGEDIRDSIDRLFGRLNPQKPMYSLSIHRDRFEDMDEQLEEVGVDKGHAVRTLTADILEQIDHTRRLGSLWDSKGGRVPPEDVAAYERMQEAATEIRETMMETPNSSPLCGGNSCRPCVTEFLIDLDRVDVELGNVPERSIEEHVWVFTELDKQFPSSIDESTDYGEMAKLVRDVKNVIESTYELIEEGIDYEDLDEAWERGSGKVSTRSAEVLAELGGITHSLRQCAQEAEESEIGQQCWEAAMNLIEDMRSIDKELIDWSAESKKGLKEARKRLREARKWGADVLGLLNGLEDDLSELHREESDEENVEDIEQTMERINEVTRLLREATYKARGS